MVHSTFQFASHSDTDFVDLLESDHRSAIKNSVGLTL